MIINLIFFIFALALLAWVIANGIKKGPPDRHGDRETRFHPKWILFFTACAFVIGAWILPWRVAKVNAGHVGIKTSLVGWNRGVSNYEIVTGWVPYNSWVMELNEFPTFQQHIEYDTQTVITKGGFSAEIRPSFNYSLTEGAVGDMYVNLRRPLQEVEQGWLRNAIVSSVNDVANRWEVDSIFNHRDMFEAAIIDEANKRVSKWFSVSQLRTNITPPPALQKSIEAKTRAIQEAEASIAQKTVAEAEASRMIAVAKGDSAAKIIEARAEAEAVRLKQHEITDIYVRYIEAQKWNGVLPTTVTGSGTPILLNR